MYILETDKDFPKDPIVQAGVINLDYLGGFKLFDNLGINQKINIQVAKTGIYLTYPAVRGLLGKNKGTTIFIPLDSINYINIEHKQQKNMVKRAATGSVVGGRRGARIGAISALGGPKTTQVETSTYQYFLQFTAENEVVDCSMVLQLTGANQSSEVDNFNTVALRNLLNEKLVSNGDFSKLNETAQSSREKQNDPYEEVIKLKSLLDKGILTEEEFNAKKKELLGL